MKKLLLGVILLVLISLAPGYARSEVGISISIGLPPPITFSVPPDVIVLPDTDDVYVVPDLNVDLFFWNGWWWRPWEGRWYRSRYYDRGWVHYRSIPMFYYDVDPQWRGYYMKRNWYGYNWYYERISHQRLQRQWQNWRNNQHWQRQHTWGVWQYRPKPANQRQELRRERERQYRARPEVRQYQQQRRQPQVQRPRQRPGSPRKPEGGR